MPIKNNNKKVFHELPTVHGQCTPTFIGSFCMEQDKKGHTKYMFSYKKRTLRTLRTKDQNNIIVWLPEKVRLSSNLYIFQIYSSAYFQMVGVYMSDWTFCLEKRFSKSRWRRHEGIRKEVKMWHRDRFKPHLQGENASQVIPWQRKGKEVVCLFTIRD